MHPPPQTPPLCRLYHYVLPSLMLWRDVSNDMFQLWYLAELDMLKQGSSYRLCDTGQGLNRVQVGGSWVIVVCPQRGLSFGRSNR